MNQAKNAFLAGIIRGWVERLQTHDTEKQACISDMLDFSDTIAKSAGVILFSDSEQNETVNQQIKEMQQVINAQDATIEELGK